MARIAWTFYNQDLAQYVTSDVMSFNRFFGRQSYLDQYAGQQMTVTIRNNANQAANWPIGARILTSAPTHGFGQTYWVSEIQYTDAVGTSITAGSGASSTATIILDDWIARAGRIQLTNFALTQDYVAKQLWNQITTAAGVLPSDMSWFGGYVGFYSGSAATYTGTIANRLNLNVMTEAWGLQVFLTQNQCQLRPGRPDPPSANTLTLQPSVGSSTGNYFVVYNNVRRLTAGQNFINNVTVQAAGVADQTRTNATSVATYGTRYNTVSTVNIDTTQAGVRAEWLANAQSSPDDLRYEVSFTDVMQGNNGANELFSMLVQQSFIYLKYAVPGSGTTTTVQCNIEGINISGTPAQSDITLYLSPNSVYADFTLDSTYFGVLDQNRLGAYY